MQETAYRYSALERVMLGGPAIEMINAELDRVGAHRAFVVTSRSVASSAPFQAIVEALGPRCSGVFAEVSAHGPLACVIAATEAARSARPDLLLAVGGGSAIDAAKLVLLCLRNDIRSVDEFASYRGFPAVDFSVRPADAARWLRLLAVPTTLSAAEFTWFGGAHDTRRRVKDPYCHPMMVPQAIILDPVITLATPLPLFLSTGMKAIDHAAERLASFTAEPLTEALSVQALRLLSRALPRVRAAPTDLEARLDCQRGMAIAMAGPAAGVGVGASHAIGHVLGGHCGVQHGHTSCVLLPSVMRWNHAANESRQQLVSEALGRAEIDAGTGLAELVESLGLPRRLRDVGVDRGDFAVIADKVLHDYAIRGNPRPVTAPAQVIEILDLAW